MTVKVIAVDMDGTFLTSDNQYNREMFKSQYQQLKEQGIHFIVASGNQYYQLRSFFPEIQNEISFVAENGGYIVDQGKDVFVGELQKEELRKVLDAIEQYPEIEKVVCGKKSAYIHEDVDQEYFDRLLFYYPRMKKVKNFHDLDDTIFKIFLSCNESNFNQILSELKEKIGHIMTPVDCGHFGIDLIIPGINKAHGIHLLMDMWDIRDGDIMSFGDSGNDKEMLEISKYSFAMENAKDSIKETAKYVIDSNNDGGVLTAIQWFLDKKEMFK